MKKFITSLPLLLTVFSIFAADEPFVLEGRVKDAITKADLNKAIVRLYDNDGNICDSVRANRGLRYNDGVLDTLSTFGLKVPRVDSMFIFDVICQGYETQTLSFKLEKIGRRERSREIPMIYLKRAPKKLGEVTVTATKIKFYNKGDTVVYNADAFQLADGSMLDNLVAQLPGAELSTDGQIKINGKFVESLLLNGKPFFDGNNNLMLENIAAYTVNNIQVYEGQSEKAKRQNDLMAPKVLTMDVRLKKEYNMGWLLNAQGGYGTDNRYMSKLFANWFNSKSRVTFIGNINNLNDNRKPGRTDTWTPDAQPNGTKEYRMAGINYNISNGEERELNGSVNFNQTIDKSYSTTFMTNFLPDGDTYENNYANNRDKETSVRTSHSYYGRVGKDFGINAYLSGSYYDKKTSNSSLSGTFDEEPQNITADILDAIYSSGTEEQLESILNRSKNLSDSRKKHFRVTADAGGFYRIPKTEDAINISIGGAYITDKVYLWKDYDVVYGNDDASAIHRRQYIDHTPNYIKRLGGSVSYSTNFRYIRARISYEYNFEEQVDDSYMYALDRLQDMGTYGVLPAGYLASFDPANSYTSRRLENTHTIYPQIQYFYNNDKGRVWAMVYGELGFTHRNFEYCRNNEPHHLSLSNAYFAMRNMYSCMAEYSFMPQGTGNGKRYRNNLRYNYMIVPELPNLFDMMDIVDDSNPLNIFIGNSNLGQSTSHTHTLRWEYTPHSHNFNNDVTVRYRYTNNALTRGYTYDTSTGVRYLKMYNVNGNNSFGVSDNLRWQFGNKKQFTLSSSTDLNFSNYADMIGIDKETPQPMKVKSRTFSELLRFSWQIGAQNISLRGDYINRHSTSSQPDFSTLNANHFTYGISGMFKLPAGFMAATDFTCYTRRGYGSATLDTTDPIWNMRLSYTPPRNSHWVFMLDGFDILHKISNVHYAVTARGRIVNYTNSLPRYFLLSVQYRLNIQPKKH